MTDIQYVKDGAVTIQPTMRPVANRSSLTSSDWVRMSKPSVHKDQPQFLARDVQMKDKRCVEFLKEAPGLIQLMGCYQRIGLEEYQAQKWDHEDSTASASTSKPQEEDWTRI